MSEKKSNSAKWYWTTGEEKFLRDNFEKMSTQKMATELNRKHSAVTMKMRRMGLKRKPSNHPAQFKPGHTRSASVEIGHVTKVPRGKKFIMLIKTEDGWVSYARHVWENANGPIPQDKKIWFVDGDQTNCDLGNLMVVTSKEAMAFARKRKKQEAATA